MAKKSKKILELEAENQAMKEILEEIKGKAEKITYRTESSELFQTLGGIEWLCGEQARKLLFDEAYKALEKESREAEKNQQQTNGQVTA